MRFLKFFHQLLFKILHPLEAPFYGLRIFFKNSYISFSVIIFSFFIIPHVVFAIDCGPNSIEDPDNPGICMLCPCKSVLMDRPVYITIADRCYPYSQFGECMTGPGNSVDGVWYTVGYNTNCMGLPCPIDQIHSVCGTCPGCPLIPICPEGKVKNNACECVCPMGKVECDNETCIDECPSDQTFDSATCSCTTMSCSASEESCGGSCYSPCSSGKARNTDTCTCPSECECPVNPDFPTHQTIWSIFTASQNEHEQTPICENRGGKKCTTTGGRRGILRQGFTVCITECPSGYELDDCGTCSPATNCPCPRNELDDPTRQPLYQSDGTCLINGGAPCTTPIGGLRGITQERLVNVHVSTCLTHCPDGQELNDCGLCVPATTCPGDKEPDPDNPGTCICPAGKSESPPGSDTCVTLTTCLGDKVELPPGSGTCACPDGEEEYPAGSDTCVPECRSDETRDEHGACVCPDGKEPVTVGGNTTCEPMCTNGKIRESGGRGCVCPTGETLQVNGSCGRPAVVDPPVHPEPTPPGPAIPDSISSLLVNTFNVHGEAAYRSVYTIGRADRPDYICWLSKDKDANNKIIKNPQKDVIMRDYTCPHLSKCRQRECECEQLLSNGVWQSIEDTYCEYAYQDPLRLERDGDLPKVLGGVDRAIERNIHVLNVIVVPAH